ncbi:MAG TPA: TonB-dependent receptor [Terriglobales bacterium]|nr:TonB-dependent receptor [Terriglobales bacterium]
MQRDGQESTESIKRSRPILAFFLALTFISECAFAQKPSKNVSEMDLEDLMNVEVSSVAKRQQPLSETAAAVYVITQEDIHRSGATSLAEALRLAPGVQVAQVNAHVWAVTIRGFNHRYANKLLVLIDGRAVYTPVFSGVVWNLEDTLLEDILRIEVIRGPGASLWGANAVNGVINIITKHSQDTQGGLLTARASGQSGSGAARFGSRWKEHFSYRIFGKYSGGIARPNLTPLQEDGWDRGQGGFRADWSPNGRDTLVLSGDVSHGSADEGFMVPLLTPPYILDSNRRLANGGGNLLSRWEHRFSNGSESTLQAYYDTLEYELPVARFHQDTVDFDFQHQLQLGARQQWIFGAGYRATTEKVGGSFMMQFNPAEQPWWQPNQKTRNLFSGFLQDEIAIAANRLSVTIGSKFESNEYTGLEYQPSIRLRWDPRPRQTMWVSVSRAVRTPSDYEEEARIGSVVTPGPQGMPLLVTTMGNRRLRSEQLLAYEAGYRIQPRRRTSFDLATFYNIYRDLVAPLAGPPFAELQPSPPHVIVPLQFGNYQYGRSYGLEVSATHIPMSFWKVVGSYSWLHMKLEPADIVTQYLPGSNPTHSFQIRSYLSLPHNLELDNNFFYTGRLDAQPVPSYLRVDARMAWHPGERLEFSVTGQNLLRPLHREFALPGDVQGSNDISRSIYGKVTWQF